MDGHPPALGSLLLLFSTMVGCPAASEPSGPAPVEQVTFTSEGVTLAGEIHFPARAGPFPAVVLVHGSGPVTRDGNRPLIGPFLTRGAAVLVYDKRGTGRSGGHFRGIGPRNSDSLVRLLGRDAAAALGLLSRHPRIDPRRLGLAGGSQAGWIIPAAAAEFAIRFAVILSGPLVSVGEEALFSDAFERSNLPLTKVDSVMAGVVGLRGYDPVPDLHRTTGAVYWILGARDRSIPAVRSAAIAESLATVLGRTSWRVDLLPTGDHNLIDPTGRSLAFQPAVVRWLDEQLTATGLAPTPPDR